MEVRFSTAVTRGFFFSLEVARYLIDHAKVKKNPLAPRVFEDLLRGNFDSVAERCIYVFQPKNSTKHIGKIRKILVHWMEFEALKSMKR